MVRIALTFVLTFIGCAGAYAEGQEIHFPRGATSTKIEGHINSSEVKYFLFRAIPGQRLIVQPMFLEKNFELELQKLGADGQYRAVLTDVPNKNHIKISPNTLLPGDEQPGRFRQYRLKLSGKVDANYQIKIDLRTPLGPHCQKLNSYDQEFFSVEDKTRFRIPCGYIAQRTCRPKVGGSRIVT